MGAPDSTGMRFRSLRAAKGRGTEQGQPAGCRAGGQAQKVGGRDVGPYPGLKGPLDCRGDEWAKDVACESSWGGGGGVDTLEL